EVDLVRVQRQTGEPDVVGLRDGAAEPAPEHVADREVLVEPPTPVLRRGLAAGCHRQLLSVSASRRRARSNTGRSTMAPSSANAPWPCAAAASSAASTRRAHATS